jgi:hypothetical protein
MAPAPVWVNLAAATATNQRRVAMPFMHMLLDPGMNYTFNRPLLDGTSPARLKEVGAIAPRIKDYDSWHTAWLELAKRAEAEKRWLDAASYYHGAEFYLPAGDIRNGLYDDFARNWALGMKGVAGYEPIAIPYPGGNLPGFRLQAKGKERSTFMFTGGYDSFVEEFYNFLLPLTELGFTVIAFDGPGQGGALRQGIYLDHAWEKPAKAVIDYFELDAVDWLGASCGGYMSIRAAAFEPRIKHIISMPTSYSGLDMTLKQMRPGKAQELISLFKAGDRKGDGGSRCQRALAELRVRMVHRSGDAHYGHQDAVRLPHIDREVLIGWYSAQRETGYPSY